MAEQTKKATSGSEAGGELHHVTGERITRKDLNEAYRKGAEDGRLASKLIDGMWPDALAKPSSPAGGDVLLKLLRLRRLEEARSQQPDWEKLWAEQTEKLETSEEANSSLRDVLARIAIPEGQHFLSQTEAATQGIEQYWAYERGCEHALAMVASRAGAALSPSTSAAEPVAFQQRVQPWMMACFGAEISADVVERNHRFLEEALELVQSTGCTAREAHQLVDYVYGRPVGETHQEIGGVMVTLAALCLALGQDMHAAGETELTRIWTKVEKIRAKQAAKPKHSPLPEHPAPAAVESAQGVKEGWQPWETAPRDDKDVLAKNGDFYQVVFWDTDDNTGWHVSDANLRYPEGAFSHWRRDCLATDKEGA